MVGGRATAGYPERVRTNERRFVTGDGGYPTGANAMEEVSGVRDPRTGPTREPVSGDRSGTIGRRSPRTGTEPVTARSPLRLRLLLAAVFLPLFLAGTALFGTRAAWSDAGDSPGRGPLILLAVVCGVLALTALLDLAVVLRRLRRERGTAH